MKSMNSPSMIVQESSRFFGSFSRRSMRGNTNIAVNSDMAMAANNMISVILATMHSPLLYFIYPIEMRGIAPSKQTAPVSGRSCAFHLLWPFSPAPTYDSEKMCAFISTSFTLRRTPLSIRRISARTLPGFNPLKKLAFIKATAFLAEVIERRMIVRQHQASEIAVRDIHHLCRFWSL